MAIAGAAGPGQWMQIANGRLVTEQAGTTTGVVERDYHAAIARILAGERVHVDVYRSLHMRVADEIERRLRSRVDDVTHGLMLAGAVE